VHVDDVGAGLAQKVYKGLAIEMERNITRFPDRDRVDLAFETLPAGDLQIGLVLAVPRGGNDDLDLPAGQGGDIDVEALIDRGDTGVADNQ